MWPIKKEPWWLVIVTIREPHRPIMRSDTARLRMKTVIGWRRDGFFSITVMTRLLLKTVNTVLMNMRKEIML